MPVDLAQIPHPLQSFAVVDGDTLRFQYWFRDTSPAGVISSLSRALAVQFCPSPPFAGERLAMGDKPNELALVDLDGDLDVPSLSLRPAPPAESLLNLRSTACR